MGAWFQGGLFIASVLPVVKVVLLCVAGALAAWKGILDDKGRRYLNLTVFWIFTPALIFYTLGGVFTFSNLQRFWFIPVNILLSYPIGLFVGWVVTMVLRVPKRLKLHVILAVSMGNTGNMPFLFVLALCGDSRTPFPAALPGSQCQTLGYGYVAMGVWVAAIFQFALAFSLLKQGGTAKEAAETAEIQAAAAPREQSRALPNGSHAPAALTAKPEEHAGPVMNGKHAPEEENEVPEYVTPAARIKAELEGDLAATEDRNAELQREDDLPSPSSRTTESEGTSQGPKEGDPSKDTKESPPTESPQPASQRSLGAASASQVSGTKQPWSKRVQRKLWQELVEFEWASFYTPPLVACYLAFFVGAIPGVRHLFFGTSRALGFVTDTLTILGNAMIPAALLVVGSVLQKGPGGKAVVPYRVLAGVVVARLFILPITGMGLVYGLASAGAFHIPDPLYFFLLLLMYMMPTSYNLQTMATLHKNGEREMGAMIFWVYIFAIPVLPFFIMFALHLSTLFPSTE